MASTSAQARPGKEIELKLALPAGDPERLRQELGRIATLQRRQARHTRLHSIYFDTPDQRLRQQQTALRLRRVGDDSSAHWLQTLKSGKREASALSSRSEWETPVAGPALELAAIDAKAWSRIDPDGELAGRLQACFVTDFARTTWLVRRRDGSTVEVALDLGSVDSAGRQSAICELELELKAGPVSALFDLAAEIATRLPVLPLAMSKAQRGYALATDAVDAPRTASPPTLWRGMSVHDTAREVLREMFGQFTGNLVALQHSDDPEVVHQARIAWRRLRSAGRLFKPVLTDDPLPSREPLDALLQSLGDLRDIDVLCRDTLPALQQAYVDRSEQRARDWDQLMQALAAHAGARRDTTRQRLQDPAVGHCLLQFTRWLDAPQPPPADTDAPDGLPSLRQWATRRATRLHERLKRASQLASNPQSLHGARILAKRTRYSIDALRDVLPRRIAGKWYRQAVDTQKRIGARRDLQRAIELLAQLQAPTDILAFVRGVAVGRTAG